MRFFIFSFLLLFIGFSNPLLAQKTAKKATTQSTKVKKINWMNFEQLEAAMEKEPKKIFVDIYTEWCGWCKKLDASTFVDPDVVKYINENYYALKFDAEQKKPVRFAGETFKYVGEGRRGYNELAPQLMQGKMSYPTMVFLTDEYQLLSVVPGFVDGVTLEAAATFFGTGEFQKTPWVKYLENFQLQKNR